MAEGSASGSAGLEDSLDDLAYAACYDDEDLRDLARRFEELGKDWPLKRAMDIYRSIGDRAEYLALRTSKLVYGGDYLDLATFYWESGERGKATDVAREGLARGTGAMRGPQAFMAERAQEAGDRTGYLDSPVGRRSGRTHDGGHRTIETAVKGLDPFHIRATCPVTHAA